MNRTSTLTYDFVAPSAPRVCCGRSKEGCKQRSFASSGRAQLGLSDGVGWDWGVCVCVCTRVR